MHYWDERTVPEIAKALGMTRGQVEARLHRVLVKLRARSAAYFGQEVRERWFALLPLMPPRPLMVLGPPAPVELSVPPSRSWHRMWEQPCSEGAGAYRLATCWGP
jgi:hypothetical protein